MFARPAHVLDEVGNHERVAEFSNREIGALFIVLSFIASVPMLVAPWPPLADYINHLSRMYVIATVGNDPDLARFYEINWQVIPNLMMDLIVPVLERVMSVFAAGQVFTISIFVLIMSGTLALNRQLFGRWSILPLIGFPLLYNNVFLVGTMNYVFGLGLALWALAAWIWLRERGVALRLGVSTLFVLALFFCHLFALGLYGLGLLSFEIYRLWDIHRHRPRLRVADLLGRRGPITDFVLSGLPFLPALPLLMLGPTWGLRGTFEWELFGKLDGLIFVIEVYSHFVAFMVCAVLAFATGWAMRSRALGFHPFGWFLLAIGTIVYVAMPRILFETFMADQRLPLSLAFTLIACTRVQFRFASTQRAFVAVLMIMLMIRVCEVQSVWADLSRSTMSMRDSVRYIDRGSTVLVSYADPDAGEDPKDLGLVHAACLAIIERSALVTTAFTVVGKQVLHVRDDFRARVDGIDGSPPTVGQLLRVAGGGPSDEDRYWRKWTADYDYLYVLFTDAEYVNPDPEHLIQIYTGERFVLYRIVRPSNIADSGEAPTSE